MGKSTFTGARQNIQTEPKNIYAIQLNFNRDAQSVEELCWA